MRITAFLPPYGFELCPLLLNGIQIGTVGRQELNGMPLGFDGLDDVRSFVERGSVENNDGCRRYGGQQCPSHPRKKDIGVNVAIPEFNREQHEVEHCPNGIQSSLRMPVMLPIASHSSRGVSVCSWRIHSKATLIEVHNGTFFDVFVPTDLRLKLYAGDSISFGMRQSFF